MKGFRDRLLIPFAVPLTAVTVILVVVFSISRVLLAMEEKSSSTMATVVAIVVASAVLFGGSWFSVRREAGGLAVLGVAGLLVVGAGSASFAALRGGEGHELAQGTEGAAGAAPPLTITAFDLGFRETELTAATGEIQIDYRDEGDLDHTLVFEGAAPATKLQVPAKGAVKGKVKLDPGTYAYYCDLPGHRAAGMEGKLTVTAGGAGGAAAGGGAANIVAHDLSFEPLEVTVPAGAVKVNLKNEGELVHNIVLEGVEGFAKLEAAGGTTASGATNLKPGKYVFFCQQPGHRAAGMEGALIVTEGGGGGAAATGGSGSSAEVVAQDLSFAPTTISVTAGPVKITLRNEGDLMHTLVVEGAKFKKLEAATHGATAAGTLEVGPGKYTFYCDQPGHRAAGMEGTIIVGSP